MPARRSIDGTEAEWNRRESRWMDGWTGRTDEDGAKRKKKRRQSSQLCREGDSARKTHPTPAIVSELPSL